VQAAEQVPFGFAQGRLSIAPSHTLRFGRNDRGMVGDQVKFNVKGSGQECPLHTSKEPHFSRKKRARNGAPATADTRLHSRLVFGCGGGVQDTEGGSAAGPDQDQGVLSVGNCGQGFLHVGCGLHGVTIDFDDDVAALQAGVVGGAAGLDLLDDRAVHITRGLQLFAQFGSDVGEAETTSGFAVSFDGVLFGFFL
jgi:hypothetical protein